MQPDEWCAVAHVDISPRSVLDHGVEMLEALASGALETEGVIAYAVLRQPVRQNHFEVVGRFASETAYLAHLCGASNLAFRAQIAPALGSPYEDRLHRGRRAERFPLAAVGDYVVVTQLEVRPELLGSAVGVLDELAEGQAGADGVTGQVVLERRERPNNIELISAWSGEQAFDGHLAAPATARARAALSPMLVAPVDDRRHHVLAGAFTTP